MLNEMTDAHVLPRPQTRNYSSLFCIEHEFKCQRMVYDLKFVTHTHTSTRIEFPKENGFIFRRTGTTTTMKTKATYLIY